MASFIVIVLRIVATCSHVFLLIAYCLPFSLSQHGADVNKRNRDNLTCLDLVKDQEGDLADLLHGDSALLDAAKKGHLKRVKKLVIKDNINCRDKHGRNSTPLHPAGTLKEDELIIVCLTSLKCGDIFVNF